VNGASVERVPLREWGLRAVALPATRRRRGQGAGRDGLRRIPDSAPAHAGLWLDRMLAEAWSPGERGWPARGDLYRAAVECLDPAAAGARPESAVVTYRRVFARFREAVTRPRPGTAIESVELRAASRLLLHTAAHETVTEGSLLLHHTYGVPYLPGSALKGAARSRLLALADRESEAARRDQLRAWADGLLGFVRDNGRVASAGGPQEARTQAALVDFLDALWIPDPATPRPLALDIVNPHHPDYYTIRRSDGRSLPTDGDSPIPVERLSVAPGARFLLVAEAPADLAAWLRWLVREILVPALAEDGLGAWTSSGYGRLIASGQPGGRAPERRSALTGAGVPSGTPAGGDPTAGSGWQPATVIWSPGNAELSAHLADGRRALARQQAARALLDAAPEDLRRRLLEGKKRRADLEVEIQPEGTSWRLVGMRPPPAAAGGDAP